MPGGKQHFDFQVTFLNSPCLALFLYHRNTIKFRSTENFAKYIKTTIFFVLVLT